MYLFLIKCLFRLQSLLYVCNILVKVVRSVFLLSSNKPGNPIHRKRQHNKCVDFSQTRQILSHSKHFIFGTVFLNISLTKIIMTTLKTRSMYFFESSGSLIENSTSQLKSPNLSIWTSKAPFSMSANQFVTSNLRKVCTISFLDLWVPICPPVLNK